MRAVLFSIEHTRSRTSAECELALMKFTPPSRHAPTILNRDCIGGCGRVCNATRRHARRSHDCFEPVGTGGLSMMEAAELLGMSERQFRRYRDRFEAEEGEAGLLYRRLEKASPRPSGW